MVGVVVGCSDELFLTATLNRSVFLQVVLVNAPFVCHAPHACHGGVSMPNMASWHAGLCYPVACAACSWRIGWSRASLAHYRRARSLSHTARCGQHTLGTGSTTTRCGVQVGAVLAEVLQAHFSGRIDRRGNAPTHAHARTHTHTHTHTQALLCRCSRAKFVLQFAYMQDATCAQQLSYGHGVSMLPMDHTAPMPVRNAAECALLLCGTKSARVRVQF
jgi:hypothetical protein